MSEPHRTFVGPLLAVALASSLTSCERAAPPADESRELIIRIENRAPEWSLYATGSFEVPAGAIEPGTLQPHERYELELELAPGTRLQLITMLVDSNDAFVAFEPEGIAVWTDAEQPTPIEGMRTDELVLWDAGTEFNEELGLGLTQGRRQIVPGVGGVEGGVITRIAGAGEVSGVGPNGHAFPSPDRFMAVEIEHLDGWRFRVSVINTSSPELLPSPSGLRQGALLSPGIYAIHELGVTLFTPDDFASLELEWQAEDGDPTALAELLHDQRGVASELSSVVWVVHGGDLKIYEPGEIAAVGIEKLAEDGDPGPLFDGLAALADSDVELGIVGYGLADAEPTLAPGESIEIFVRAEPGDELVLVTGYLAANDKFVGVGPAGIPLFDAEGEPRTGDLSWTLDLLDAGTEVDETLGLGPNQFGRQAGAGAGIEEHGVVAQLLGPWMGTNYPQPDDIVGLYIDVIEDNNTEGN